MVLGAPLARPILEEAWKILKFRICQAKFGQEAKERETHYQTQHPDLKIGPRGVGGGLVCPGGVRGVWFVRRVSGGSLASLVCPGVCGGFGRALSGGVWFVRRCPGCPGGTPPLRRLEASDLHRAALPIRKEGCYVSFWRPAMTCNCCMHYKLFSTYNGVLHVLDMACGLKGAPFLFRLCVG